MSQLWQHPYVNVFKHFNIQSWKKASKDGEVVSAMDKTLKCTVYKITGSIPAGNYIQLPQTSSQSLGLTGRYMYLLFRPIAAKYFVVHIDVATQDGLVVRISFSNLFKEFKSTSTWLQFPFMCNASKGSVCSHTAAVSKEYIGPAPLSTLWTVLCLDFQYILSIYLNRRYSYMKSIKMCANMNVKNIFTSDMEYEPGLTLEQVRKSGVTLHGMAPMPREMSFPLGKGQTWHEQYDMIRFPSEASKKPFDSIQPSGSGSSLKLSKSGPVRPRSPKRVEPRTVHVSRAVSDRVALIDRLTSPRGGSKVKKVVSELPMVGVDGCGDVSIEQTADGEVHVYAHPDEPVLVHQRDSVTGKVAVKKMNAPSMLPAKQDSYKSLTPDPILQLRRIVGFGGATVKDALWTSNGAVIVYPCNAVVVAMQVSNGQQRFFIGHTDKVSCVSLNGKSTLLASGQTGPQSVVRVWNFQSGECLAMFKTHTHSLMSLSMSHRGSVLCGVGKDGHGKNMVVLWNTERVTKAGQVAVLAKAHTDVDILRMRIAAFDDTRMVSCGRDNIRLWRIKDGALRSAPVNLGEHHLMEFSDCCFEAGFEATKDPLDRLVYACSKSGHIFEVDYRKVAIHHVRRLLPVDPSKREKQTFSSGAGIAINSMCVNEAFCVTGSDDGYLRLWPLDFKHVYLEAEHEGPVTAVDISADGVKILAGTSTGNLGVLDVSTRGYTTVMRSHTGRILCMSLDPLRRHMATVSEDHTIRIWDLDTMQQLYDFTAPKECPCAIAYHPSQQLFACGFQSGAVRVFNVSTTSLLAEHRQHRGQVVGLAFSPAPGSEHLYSAGSLGSLALYDASDNQYQLLRLLGNTVARGEGRGPEALAVSADGRFVAFVGPTEFTVTVVDGRSLDEVLRIDITSINPGDSVRNVIDTAIKVKYSPASVRHLLVTTSNNRVLKFDARNGKILTEIDNIHRGGCTALDISADGRHLATAGDRVVKIWDYHMRLDLNFQVFIGHSEAITKAVFTPDSLGFISVGEAIFLWDFLAAPGGRQAEPGGRAKVKNYFTGKVEDPMPYNSPCRKSLTADGASELPRSRVPQPASQYALDDGLPRASALYAPGQSVADLSAISLHQESQEDLRGADVVSVTSEREEVMIGPDLQEIGRDASASDSDTDTVEAAGSDAILGRSPRVQKHKLLSDNPVIMRTPVRRPSSKSNTPSKQGTVVHPKPNLHKIFCQREKHHSLAPRRYTAPPNQAGLKLNSVIGYNGNGRGNMVWHADTGIFAYTSGCIVIVEDINAGTQQHLMGHGEEISTLALQHDCQVLASASGSFKLSPSQIFLWDLQEMVCKKVLTHHEFDVVCLAYSRDDRFLISVGDYRECMIAVWSTYSHTILTSTKSSQPILDLQWDPFTVNEFASVGVSGSVSFWLLDETGTDYSLSVHQVEPPADLVQKHHVGVGQVDMTCLEYGGDSTLFVATSGGMVSAWDTRHNSCFMHWEADTAEIDFLISRHGRLITGSAGRSLRLWSVSGVGELRSPAREGGPGPSLGARGAALTMEDEMTLDGAIVSVAFDDTMDLGIVGTNVGTLWYISWAERTSIRLVSGHASKINALALCDDQLLGTCGEDGGLRVWSVSGREQTVHFQVHDQSCNCLAFAPRVHGERSRSVTSCRSRDEADLGGDGPKTLPNIVAGYSDGTVRMFDLAKVDMVLKMHPHAVAVTAITFSADGRMIVSGGSDGLVAISSPTTGMTVRVISDHKGAPITGLDVAFNEDRDLSVAAPMLWLAASADRRVSVWSADWSKDFCELVDWLTFPAPAFTPDGAVIKKGDQSYLQQVPPSLARFSHEEPDVIVYAGYGMQKTVQFYSLAERKVVRTVPLTHWATSIDLSSAAPVIAIGNNERLLKLMDYYEGSFQDFTGHHDSLSLVRLSPSGKLLFSVAHNEVLVWEVCV